MFIGQYGKNTTDQFPKANCNIENLVLIDNEENLEMNRSRLRFADPERTKTGVLVAKARVTVRQKKRRK